MSLADRFNRSAFSHWVNTPGGRAARLGAGGAFLAAGLLASGPLAVVLLAWSVVPLSAGACDLCYISAALGGPVRGARIRALQATAGPRPAARARPAAG